MIKCTKIRCNRIVELFLGSVVTASQFKGEKTGEDTLEPVEEAKAWKSRVLAPKCNLEIQKYYGAKAALRAMRNGYSSDQEQRMV